MHYLNTISQLQSPTQIRKILIIRSQQYICNPETHVSYVNASYRIYSDFLRQTETRILAFRNVQTDSPYLNIHYRLHFIVFRSNSSVVIFPIFFIISVISLTNVILVMSSLSLFFRYGCCIFYTNIRLILSVHSHGSIYFHGHAAYQNGLSITDLTDSLLML